MFSTSEQINEIATALAKAQGEFTLVEKKGEGKITERHSYKYAELADVMGMAMPVLSKNGLSLSQFATTSGNDLELVTLLAHSSGQFFMNVATFPLVKLGNNAMQGVGGTHTYARRYEVMGILGLSPHDSDLAEATDMDSAQAEQKTPSPKNQNTEQDSGHGGESLSTFAKVVQFVNRELTAQPGIAKGVMAQASVAKNNELELEAIWSDLQNNNYDRFIFVAKE